MRQPPDSDAERLHAVIGKCIAAARRRVCKSQSDLAAACRLTRGSVANIESGRQHAPIHTLWAIAIALGEEPRSMLPLREEFDGAAVTLPEGIDRRVSKVLSKSDVSVQRFVSTHHAAKKETKHGAPTKRRIRRG